MYAIAPLANEYQVERLLKLCEKVLEETVRRRWEKPDGEEACKQVYRHLIIADTCNLRGLKKLCVNIAADASSSDRERAMADHPIPADLDIEINKLAVRKHEMIVADVKEALTSGSAIKDFVRKVIPEKPKVPVTHPSFGVPAAGLFGQPSATFGQPSVTFGTPSVTSSESTTKANHMRCLRLANAFLPLNQQLIKDVVSQIRLDRNTAGWEEKWGKQFDILPECVKHDVIGRFTYTCDF